MCCCATAIQCYAGAFLERAIAPVEKAYPEELMFGMCQNVLDVNRHFVFFSMHYFSATGVPRIFYLSFCCLVFDFLHQLFWWMSYVLNLLRLYSDLNFLGCFPFWNYHCNFPFWYFWGLLLFWYFWGFLSFLKRLSPKLSLTLTSPLIGTACRFLKRVVKSELKLYS